MKLHFDVKIARQAFDKKPRNCERASRNGLEEEIETVYTDNPRSDSIWIKFMSQFSCFILKNFALPLPRKENFRAYALKLEKTVAQLYQEEKTWIKLNILTEFYFFFFGVIL